MADDWDDVGTAQPAKSSFDSYGSGSGYGDRGGRGRGRGRGSYGGYNNQSDDKEQSSGGGGGGGFDWGALRGDSGPKTVTSDYQSGSQDDSWNTGGDTGAATTSDFGEMSLDDRPRGRGRGGRGGGFRGRGRGGFGGDRNQDGGGDGGDLGFGGNDGDSFGEGRGRGRGRGRGGGGGDRGGFSSGGAGGQGGPEGEAERPPSHIPTYLPETEEALFANDMQTGINFDRYDKISVDVTSDDPSKKKFVPVATFDAAGLSATVAINVHKAEYKKPTPIQKYAIPIIQAGQDMMACAQTGSGKTAAFLLPIITSIIDNDDLVDSLPDSAYVKAPKALIVAPTRELAQQIYCEAKKFCYNTVVKPCFIYGGINTRFLMNELSKGCHILVATVGRLKDMAEKGSISLRNVKFFVLDEADRMLDMGFEPDIRKIVGEFGLPSREERVTLMFSATFPESIQNLAREFLRPGYYFVKIGRVGSANEDVEQVILKVARYDKRQKLLDLLNAQPTTDKTLIFVEQKRMVDIVGAFLCQSNFPTTTIHGDRFQFQREEALHDFKVGKTPLLVASSVASRGLDIPKVMHVINYDLPHDADEYVHRIGRTGRVGNRGRSTSFFDPENAQDRTLAPDLIRVLTMAGQEVPCWIKQVADGTYQDAGPNESSFFDVQDNRSNLANFSRAAPTHSAAAAAPADDEW